MDYYSYSKGARGQWSDHDFWFQVKDIKNDFQFLFSAKNSFLISELKKGGYGPGAGSQGSVFKTGCELEKEIYQIAIKSGWVIVRKKKTAFPAWLFISVISESY